MTELFRLDYEIELRHPAIFTTLASTNVLQETERFVPGGVMLGALAGRFIAKQGFGADAHVDPDFARMFLTGGVRFLNAYPSALDETPARPVRLLPVPSSILIPKREGDHTPYDQSARSDAMPDGLVSMHGFCDIRGDVIATQSPETEISYHTQRDRALGRALAGKGPFGYEALRAGQRFRGVILGPESDLQTLQALMPDHLTLGRSRRAQYGDAVVRVSAPPAVFTSEAAHIARQAGDDGADGPDCLVLTLTSHLVLRPGERELLQLDRLAAILGVGQEDLRKSMRSFASLTWLGGYSGIHGLPRRQARAVAAGSVFVFALPISPTVDAETHSLGERTAEGYGRFVLDMHAAPITRYEKIERPPVHTKPAGARPPLFDQIVQQARLALLLDEARTAGRIDASKFGAPAIPKNAAMARIIEILRDSDFPAAAARINELTRQGEKPFNRALRAFACKSGTFADMIGGAIGRLKDASAMPAQALLTGNEEDVISEDAAAAASRLYALSLLYELRRSRKREAVKDRQTERVTA